MRKLPLILLLMLGACQTAVTVECGTNRDITPEQQRQAAAELRTLPDDSVVGNVIVPDWIRMRDENRACAEAR